MIFAALAGVTKMTVSRYLRTPDKVKPETAERIASVIAEIGYEPDPDNPAMTSVAVPRIGVLIPSFHNQIFAGPAGRHRVGDRGSWLSDAGGQLRLRPPA
ncbi:Gluconate utilization system GNT-I transcriptional repressor [Raoultella planticola]|uniref:Gluconate utilization system GNT-I transcriptional repressor n=1 Tax=Raoultella planticola TaxID=575 RepID=A0A485B094_RAOPL|nr:Gluconate utilization system GNT-I transcriptional repressor [Raoultella planticola]